MFVAEEATNASRREQILSESERLFAAQGFRETNLDQVADALGFRRQAIYHYFKTKDDILSELILRAGHALDESAEPIFTSDTTPSEKLEALVRNQVRQVLLHASVFRIQFEELDKMTDPRGAEVREGRDQYVRRFAAVLADGREAGEFLDSAPTTTQALLIIGMCNWTVAWYSPATHMSIDDVAGHAARTAVHGVLNSKPARRPRPRVATQPH